MDPKDRLFADIAVRLQLLTRDQAATCMQHSERSPGKSVGDLAVELGYINHDEVALVRAQEARALERQRRSVPAPALVEERAKKSDPRSASSPPPAAEPSAKGRGRKRGPRTWEAPTHPAYGQVHVPHEVAPSSARGKTPTLRPSVPQLSEPPQRAVPTAQPFDDDDRPTGLRARPSANEIHSADTAPARVPAAVRQAPAAADFDEFPMAEGREAAVIADSKGAAPAGPYLGAAGGTLMHPFATPSVEEDPAAAARASLAMGATLVGPAVAAPPPAGASAAFPSPASATLIQGFAAPPVAAAPATQTPTVPPPKAAARRPGLVVAPSDSYLGKALTLALRHGASDLHAHSGAPLLIRVDGQIRPLSGTGILSAEAADKVIAEITTDAQWSLLSTKGEVDFAYEIPGLARFRVNVYRQQRGLDAVFRIIGSRPPTLEELGLPARLARLTDYRTGLLLCTGPAGCGKSTTLAALMYGLTQSRADHVLTIEDPVEYVYPKGRALVNQRQVRDHTRSFARALRAALREDPDVIVITELRDRDTIGLAISAAETGHLVLGTLHTGNAAQTIHRMVSSFPADEQEQVRSMLSESLRAVVSQRLVPMAVGRGRVPALELLMVNTAVSNLIREDKTHQLPSVMQTGRVAGMITLDDSLADLVSSGVVTAEAARRFAVKKERFT